MVAQLNRLAVVRNLVVVVVVVDVVVVVVVAFRNLTSHTHP
jgi:hypothetical protein